MATNNTKSTVAATVGAGLAAAGAAGYYFYASPKAKSHRKIAAKWATDLKDDVVREAKKVQKLRAKDFAKIVDVAAEAYHGIRSIDAGDVRRAAKELKSNWQSVQEELTAKGRRGAERARSAIETSERRMMPARMKAAHSKPSRSTTTKRGKATRAKK
jgi:hypothetical protein